MANVNSIEGIKYGFGLMGYLIGIYIIAALLLVVGFGMIDGGSEFLGGLIALVGFVSFFAGLLGMGFKVIADGVERGVDAANGSVSSDTGFPPESQSGQRERN